MRCGTASCGGAGCAATAFPALFLAEPLNGAALPLALALGAVLALGASPLWFAGYAALWYLAEILLSRAAGWLMGPRDAAALILRDALMPALWAATFLRRGIDWRGHAMSAPEAAGAHPAT